MTTPTDWQAHWIWNQDNGGSRYVTFRRTFEIVGETATAALRVCADTRYRLWLNGQALGHGPARGTPVRTYYDTYDIAQILKPGVNTLAALVVHYGIGACAFCLGKPGFLLQADIVNEGGEALTFGTDTEWRVAPAPYAVGFERMSIQLPYPEVFDARQEQVNWNLSGFDDKAWKTADIVAAVGDEPWSVLAPRDIPLPHFRTITPQRILQINAVELPSPPDSASQQSVMPSPPDPLSQKQERGSSTPAHEMDAATRLAFAPVGSVSYRHPALFTVAPQSGSRGVSIVLDFGKEVSGFPLLIVRKGGGGRIDIGYSERIETDGTVSPNRSSGGQLHYADRLTLRPGFQRYETLDHRAFRYLRLDIYDNPEPLEILAEMTTSGYPVQPLGDFQCSDPLLQTIWEVGRYTTELCMDDGFMDCPQRERGQWLGDAWVEMLVAAYAFGDTALARKALSQFPQSQNEAGWFKGVYPSDTDFDAILPTFCMIWLPTLWDYFVLTNDATLLHEVWNNVERLTAAILNSRNDDGLVGSLPGWVFVDWADVNTSGYSTPVNAYAYHALRSAGRIARAVGQPERGGEWEMLAVDIKEAVNDLLWDNTRGVYVDGIVDGERAEKVSEQGNSLCALFGIAEREQTARILGNLLAETPAFPITRIGSPYFSFYLLRLLYKEGRHGQALQTIRERWGDQIAKGATTFWEEWHGQTSRCHAWSAGPTHDLMAEFAGIRPVQPGFEEFTVHPQPCDLTWLNTVVPTPHGDIVFRCHFRDEAAEGEAAITVNLDIPAGTLASVRIPLREIPAPNVVLNGQTIWEQGKSVDGASKYRREGDFLAFSASGGRCHLVISRQ